MRRAIGFARPFRDAIAILFTMTVVLALANACEPLLIKYGFGLLSPEQRLLARSLRKMEAGFEGLAAIFDPVFWSGSGH